ncbi:hypothetical protein MMC10_000329 [Thelotrema lepadinum]|nr:hypothetical protein [Thelotrema lepadinum]
MRLNRILIVHLLISFPFALISALAVSSPTIHGPYTRHIDIEPLLPRDNERLVLTKGTWHQITERNVPIGKLEEGHVAEHLGQVSKLSVNNRARERFGYPTGYNVSRKNNRDQRTLVPLREKLGRTSDENPPGETRIFARVTTEPKDVRKAQNSYRRNADMLMRLRTKYEDQRKKKDSKILRHINQNLFISRLAAEVVRDEHNQFAEQEQLRKIADNNIDYLRLKGEHVDAENLAGDANKYFMEWRLYYDLLKHIDTDNKASHPLSINRHSGLERRSQHTKSQVSVFPPAEVKEAQYSYRRHVHRLMQMRTANGITLKTLGSVNPWHAGKNWELSQVAREVIRDERNQLAEQQRLRHIANTNSKTLRTEGRHWEAENLEKDASRYFNYWNQNYDLLRFVHSQNRLRKSSPQGHIHRRMEKSILPRIPMNDKDVHLAVSTYRLEKQKHEEMMQENQRILSKQDVLITKADWKQHANLLQTARQIAKDRKNQLSEQTRLAVTAVNNVNWLRSHDRPKQAELLSQHSMDYFVAMKKHYNFLVSINAAEREKHKRAKGKK